MSSEENSPSEFYYPDEILNDENNSGNSESEQVPPSSQEKIEAFIAQQKSDNTMKKTRSDLNIVIKYLNSIQRGNKAIESLPADELDHLLSKFFMEVRKSDGGEYEPNTISSYQRSIQRFLQEKKYPYNILKDKQFEKSRQVLTARRKDLVKKGKGNKPQATKPLTEEEEETLFNTGQFGDDNPEALQRTMWWIVSLHFGFRARDESRKLRWGDVELQVGNNGREMLVWTGERGTKTRTGEEQGHQRAFQPKAVAIGGMRCPVELYKKIRSHRPAEMNAPDSPFFLAVKYKRAANDTVWFTRSPLGKNQIGKLLSTAAKNAGLQQSIGAKISNHSVRKTGISRLLEADVPETFVAQLSGHKSVDSLKHYKSAGEKHQQAMSLALSRAAQSQEIIPVARPSGCVDAGATRYRPATANLMQIDATTTSSTNTANADVSSFFSGVHSVSGCSFQIFNGPVTFNQPANPSDGIVRVKRRRVVIESDDEDE